MRLAPIVAGALCVVVLASVSGSALGAEAAFRRVVVARGLSEPVQVTGPRSEPRRLYVVEAWGDPPERNPLPPEAAARFRLAGTHVWRGAPPVAVLEFAPRRPGAAG